MKKILIVTVIIALFAFSAGAREHENVLNLPLNPGSLPSKGLYYTMGYNAGKATTNRDKNGDAVNNGYSFRTMGMTNLFIWMPGVKLFGADYGVKLGIGYVDNTMKINPGGNYIKMHGGGLTDPALTPLALGWHTDRFDISTEFMVYMPYGYYTNYSKGMSIGQDHWTVSPKLGLTYYLDPEKTFSVSTLVGYEYNFENLDKDIEQGDQLYAILTLSKVMAQNVTLGVHGYGTWKLEDDSGDDAAAANRDRVYALGPEVKVFVPALHGSVAMKYMKEFGARSRAENDHFRLAVSWKF